MSKPENLVTTPYDPRPFFDEMFVNSYSVRSHYQNVFLQFMSMKAGNLSKRQTATMKRMMEEGITFTLYSPDQAEALERTIPFDPIPRIIPRDEWLKLERGLQQRVKALNLFLKDIYHDQCILKEGIIPRKMVLSNCYFRPEMMRLSIPNDVYVTVSGIDLIRDEHGEYFVLEDNLRSPSGFSYLYKSRSIMTHLFPELVFSHSIQDIEHSLNVFLSALRRLSPSGKSDPVIGLLTPGCYNSAYFEHTFLAQQMGIQLVEGHDLVVIDHKVYIRGIKGLRQIDVLYRRIDDDFLDPLAFDPNSMLGVAGIMNAYRAGNINIVNAPGTGVADDKAIYAYVPDMIRYYLNEEPILNNVPTYILSRPEELDHVLQHLDEMVVKETSLSGGYGMLIGPSASESELADFRLKIIANPDRYIAQPTIQLSRAPVMMDGQMTARHIDLRAFVIAGESIQVIPGGLTRVALKEGSLVVNSSQGGGCKDTWVTNS
ncbi:putative circularly permuted ATP-grasp superfamily protein [Paenibacillus sp. V4I3]|uniref:circularly permuted type 2 ATP-grasp protein n=1 Tax=unclassified Paenibacillus TaxID=185978 RepID=UPI00278BA3B1|nr:MULTISPECIES: circularly permuted type 2 ATP-grasp protein [unclassified Paenibacillus]MDQ0873604.1 putative circularly permuted ATP-grasp superfamily protein [Paenibacillus sp. V4I3]MDQ0890467.1 putative circularly permuted ATP-grasp superfamily protein [Paenibacillus sp. V4I9]